MKLFAWQPKGHGELSMFVMAKNEDEALKAVNKKIAELIAKYEDDNYFEDDGNYGNHSFSGFGSDYYTLTVCEAGEVIFNDND